MPYLEFLNRWLCTPQCIFSSLKTFLWALHMIPASELPYRRAWRRRKPPSSAASAVSPWGVRSLHSEKMSECLLFILAWNCCRSTLDSRADTPRVLHCRQAAPESEPIFPLEVSVQAFVWFGAQNKGCLQSVHCVLKTFPFVQSDYLSVIEMTVVMLGVF